MIYISADKYIVKFSQMLSKSQILGKQLQYSSQFNFHVMFGRMDSNIQWN